jgi:hypothetical protein
MFMTACEQDVVAMSDEEQDQTSNQADQEGTSMTDVIATHTHTHYIYMYIYIYFYQTI